MKQENPTTSPNESKATLSQSTTPSRLRAYSKAKDSSRSEGVNGVSSGLKARPRSVPPDPSNSQKVRRSLVVNKPKSGEDAVGSQKGRELEETKTKIVGRCGNRPVVEQFSRLRRRADLSCKGNEDDPDGKKKELQEKLDASENLLKDLQSEISKLKEQMEKVQSLNMELESQKTQLAEDLAAAEAKISALNSRDRRGSVAEELQKPNFKDIQKLMANKLDHFRVKEDINKGCTIKEPLSAPLHPVSKAADIQRKVSLASSPPPPPPLPPPPRGPARTTITPKAPAIFDVYHSLTKLEGKKGLPGQGSHNKPVVTNAHSSIVGEIQNRSAHLLAIKADVATKGEFINVLIQKVQAAAYASIDDVLEFVDWLDAQLSSLADEHAVLKHFNWPEKKADVMREAAIEYRDLKRLENELSSFKDDIAMPCGAALKKIASLLDKSERSIQRLIKLRGLVMLSYRNLKIPTDWMLDSGMISKIKQASMMLAKMYMTRVSMELESFRNSERESTQEALLLQGVRFAYRIHQFAGGLDSETMCALEEIRQRVPVHAGGSRDMLAGIVAS